MPDDTGAHVLLQITPALNLISRSYVCKHQKSSYNYLFSSFFCVKFVFHEHNCFFTFY